MHKDSTKPNHQLSLPIGGQISMQKGFSLLEMVVVLSVFALLAVISSQALILTLQGAKKSSNLATVRENVDFAMQIIERQLHNASEVTPCPNVDSQTLTYKDQNGEVSTFSCIEDSPGLPPYVQIDLAARNTNVDTGPASSITTSTRVFLRNY